MNIRKCRYTHREYINSLLYRFPFSIFFFFFLIPRRPPVLLPPPLLVTSVPLIIITVYIGATFKENLVVVSMWLSSAAK